jgi:hypothetical protein
MKFYKKLGIYKNSTETCTFDPVSKESFSYNWFKITEVRQGKLIFNNYSYSMTTRKHQTEVLRLLNREPDIIVEAPEGLGKPCMFTRMSDVINIALNKLEAPKVRKKTKWELVDRIRKALMDYELMLDLYPELKDNAPKFNKAEIELKLKKVEESDPNKVIKVFNNDLEELLNEKNTRF